MRESTQRHDRWTCPECGKVFVGVGYPTEMVFSNHLRTEHPHFVVHKLREQDLYADASLVAASLPSSFHAGNLEVRSAAG